MDTPLSFIHHAYMCTDSHRQHLLLQLWQVIKSREHKSVFTALYFSSSSLVSTGNSDVVLPARACILHLLPFIIMNSLPLHWHVVPTQTHGPFLKAQINKSSNKMKTWSQKHDTISFRWTSPAPAPPTSAALCPVGLKLFWMNFLSLAAAWRHNDSTRQSWRETITKSDTWWLSLKLPYFLFCECASTWQVV